MKWFWVCTIIGLVVIGIYLTNLSSKIHELPKPSPVATLSPSPSTLQINPKDPNNMIILESPVEGSEIRSPLTITGRAKGNWFFEASFPVVLTDWDGKIIAEGAATTSENWMTTDFVFFSATLPFERPNFGDRGALILRKDNPSGLPENDAAYEITVYFAK